MMPSGPHKSERRQALLDQLAYLIDEIDALRAVVHRVPEPVLAGRPLPSDWSIKEMYGLLAAADRDVFLPALERVVAEDEPSLAFPEGDALLAADSWNDRSMDDILDAVRDARARLVGFLRELPPREWDRTALLEGDRRDIYALAYHIVQHDTESLRAAGFRLHESHLTSGPDDLPK